MWNRGSFNFPHSQGPVARKKSRNATQILRAGNILPASRGNPRNGGPGVRRIWTRSVHPEPSPGDPLVSFPSLGKKLALQGETLRRPQAAKFPVRKEPSSGPMRASGPTKKRSIIAPSSVTASPCHLPPRGKALRGRPPGGRLIKNETGAPGRPFSRGRLIALIGDTNCWSDTGARR